MMKDNVRPISKYGKNILECKLEAYISNLLGFIPANIIPARCINTKKTKINPLYDWDFCLKASKSKNQNYFLSLHIQL